MAITYNERDVARIEANRSIVEAIGGIIVGLLAIISLTMVFPSLVLLPIAVIVLGLALLVEGRTIAAESARFMGLNVDAGPLGNRTTTAPEANRFTGVNVEGDPLGNRSTTAPESSRFTGANVNTGPVSTMHAGRTTWEYILGGAIVVLGILALIGISPDVLIAIAVIVAGATLILGSRMLLEMSDLHNQMSGQPGSQRRLARASASGAVSIQMLCGVAAIVLGILALTTVHVNGLLLSDIGLLVLAAAIMLGSGLWTGSLFRMLG